MKWKIALVLVLVLSMLTVAFSGCVEEEVVVTPAPPLAPRVEAASTPTPKPVSIPLPTHQHISQPAPTNTSTQAQGESNLDLGPLKFSGEGTLITPPFKLESGTYIFRMKNDGSSNFTVLLLNDKHVEWCGCYEYITAVPVNTIGPFDGVKTVEISDSGNYILDIDAEEGQWSIIIEKP
ncbi:hypothetical protein ACFLY8_00855 [Halobacteriota archaeon]